MGAMGREVADTAETIATASDSGIGRHGGRHSPRASTFLAGFGLDCCSKPGRRAWCRAVA